MADSIGLEFSLTSNRELVENATQEAIENALEAVGFQAEGYAKMLAPVSPGGGNLRNSITHEVDLDENAVYIGTDVYYAPYVEFGTGIYADNGEGRQTPWRYQDDEGNWHYTQGQKPTHFFRNSMENNLEEYKSIAEAMLSKLNNQ